jgi:hypothetical protein
MNLGLGIGLGFGVPLLAPFAPTNINGIELWLRADKGYASGTWTDQSGTSDANKNCTQAASGQRPTLNASDAAYNHQATLSFVAASSQYLQSGNWAVPMVQPWTLCIVGNDDGAAANEWWFDNNQSPETELFNNAAGSYSFSAGSSLNSTVSASSAARVWIVTASGGVGTIYMNAKTSVQTGSIGSQGWAGTTLGAYYGAAFFLNGKLAEVLAYNSALSASDRGKLFDYAGGRYGISIGA